MPSPRGFCAKRLAIYRKIPRPRSTLVIPNIAVWLAGYRDGFSYPVHMFNISSRVLPGLWFSVLPLLVRVSSFRLEQLIHLVESLNEIYCYRKHPSTKTGQDPLLNCWLDEFCTMLNQYRGD